MAFSKIPLSTRLLAGVYLGQHKINSDSIHLLIHNTFSPILVHSFLLSVYAPACDASSAGIERCRCPARDTSPVV